MRIALALAVASSLSLAACSRSSGARTAQSRLELAGDPGHDAAAAGNARHAKAGAHAAAAHDHGGHTAAEAKLLATKVLANMLKDNEAYAKSHDKAFFDRFRESQHAKATVVACADSRFHTSAIDQTPDDELFVIRNIGNQVDATAGSVEYGIRHLNTPVLLVVGHVGCGAVKAAMGDYDALPHVLRRELDGLHLSIFRTRAIGTFEQRWLANVIGNVHQQVRFARTEFADLVGSGRLFIVGAVYDFRDDLGHGAGRVHIIDVNGEQDGTRIAALPVIADAYRLYRELGATPAPSPAPAPAPAP